MQDIYKVWLTTTYLYCESFKTKRVQIECFKVRDYPCVLYLQQGERNVSVNESVRNRHRKQRGQNCPYGQ